MLKEFEDMRQSIRKARENKNYKLAIDKCLIYLSMIDNFPSNETITDRFFIYHDLAVSYKQQNDIKLALKYESMAINYTHVGDYHYTISLWGLAVDNSELGNMKEALHLYTKCSQLYKEQGEKQQRICTIWNKAKLLKNIKAMKKLIIMYQSTTYSKFETYGDLEHDTVLNEMRTDLNNMKK